MPQTVNNRLVDIHTHILPQMDDGAQTVEESIKLLLELLRQGITDVVLTPHFDSAKESVEAFCQRRAASFDLLQRELETTGLCRTLTLHLGAEVRYDPNLIYADTQKLCIGNTSYLLLELTGTYPFNFENTANFLLSRGIIPILAHIERYNYLYSDTALLDRLLADGFITQCNASSLLSHHYSSIIKKLLKRGQVQLLASDTHSLEKRPPQLIEALKKLKKHRDYLISNSAKVISDELI